MIRCFGELLLKENTHYKPLDKGALVKFIFLFLNQNICREYSKEPSHWDGSFEHPKHILKPKDKKIFTILR